MKQTASQQIDAYIKAAPPKTQSRLKLLRELIQATAPEATEVISYKMPTFQYHGFLVGFAAYQKHVGFYPMNGTFIKAHQKELADFKSSKGAIQFSLDQPLPLTLIKKFVKIRMKENLAKAKQKAKKTAKRTAKTIKKTSKK